MLIHSPGHAAEAGHDGVPQRVQDAPSGEVPVEGRVATGVSGHKAALGARVDGAEDRSGHAGVAPKQVVHLWCGGFMHERSGGF